MKHFTPAAQEWFNSIYAYNQNSIKSLSIADKNLMFLLKSYFNSKENIKYLTQKTKIKRNLCYLDLDDYLLKGFL